ncbi:MAG: aldo/keto reductase [Acholeplasmataceae bacterium]
MIKLRNGVMMPKLGLGTFRIMDRNECVKVIQHALEVGYRHIDTAQMYQNEACIGEAIASSKFDRKDIFITSKQRHHMPLDDAKSAFEETLANLQTDYVDLFLIHWPNHDKEINQETWCFFESLYEQKKARAIGISNFQRHHIMDLYETARVKPFVNQVELHPGLPQLSLKRYLDSEGIMTTSYGPLMKGGVFEGHYGETLGEIARKYDATIAQVVIAWGLARNVIMIPKSATLKRIEENFQAKDLVLDSQDIMRINELSRGERVYTDPDNSPWGIYKSYKPEKSV